MKLPAEVRADLLAAVRLAPPAGAPRDRAALEQLLYTAWFTGTKSGPATGERAGTGPTLGAANRGPATPGLAAPSLGARLRAAHAATARLEGGWFARSVGPGGALVAERAGELLELAPPDYVNVDRPAAPVRAGDALAVTARRDWIDADGGWWVTSAAAGPAPAAMARIYWNCPPQSATALVAGITGALEPPRVPYTLKCPLVDELFERTEPVVLYLGFAEWAAAKPALHAVHAALAGRLRPAVPPLTLRLGPGAAAAEDPADGRSFGQSRAAAVADGLVRATEENLTDEDATLAVLVERLEAHDISPARPYLRAGSPDDLVTGW